MNSSGIGREARGIPYVITYVKGERQLADSADTLDAAKARISARLAKRHNRGEHALVHYRHKLVFDSRQ
jgi:hypothetical protein